MLQEKANEIILRIDPKTMLKSTSVLTPLKQAHGSVSPNLPKASFAATHQKNKSDVTGSYNMSPNVINIQDDNPSLK